MYHERGRTGEAFIARARVHFITWTDRVAASHTDLATEPLLKNPLLQESPPAVKVAATGAEVGPAP